MASKITRRDFLNGTALSIAAGLLPADQRAWAGLASDYYPPKLTGLRGSHDGAFETAHDMRDGKAFSIDAMAAEETFDLIVVGAGLAGLSAAWFYREQQPKARILILDNHDDFGGHAKRNEFDVNGRMILGYGGSESMVSPRTSFDKSAKRMFRALRLNPERFYDESVFHRTLYPKLGLAKGVFFDSESFGADKLVAGDPTVLGFDEFGAKNPNARPLEKFLADCPLSEAARKGLTALYQGKTSVLPGMNASAKAEKLAKISYRDFLANICGLPKDGCDFFQGRSNDNFGLGIDAIAAIDAISDGFPGADSLGPGVVEDDGHGGEPYIHHFPDGNASIARLIVRSLIPDVAPGRDMDSIVTARFDYSRLDRPQNRVRIRLNSTAVVVKNDGKGVAVGYVTGGKLHRVAAKRAIVTAYNVIVPHLVPELPKKQKEFMGENTKAPLLYTKVIIRNWESFVKLGVHNIAAPMSFSTTVKLDYPVSLGAYKFPRDPKEPIGLQLVHVPLVPNQGLSARDQCRAGRVFLLTTPYETIESRIRADLDRMLGPGGFDAKSDILATTVNRWSHGYSYYWNSLYDDVEKSEEMIPMGRAPVGRIFFASSDTAWDAYAHAAIAEASRAVREALA